MKKCYFFIIIVAFSVCTATSIAITGRGGENSVDGKMPEYGDVIIRTLRPTETRPGRKGTIDAAIDFGANRVEWIYDVTENFLKQVQEAGIFSGATMDPQGRPGVTNIPDYYEKFTSRDLQGDPVTRTNFRKFSDWPIGRFTADVNIAEWKDLYIEHVAGFYNLPIISIMRDDRAATAGLIVDGGSYTDDSIKMFQQFLAEHVSEEELARLGIENPETYDIRPHLISLGAPATEPEAEQKKWVRWDGGPILRLYARAQMEAVAEFYRNVRKQVEEKTGRNIPWSCNHTGQWGPIERNFDYALGEFYTHQMQMETMVELARRADEIDKIQGLQGVLDGGWETRDPAGLVEEMRLGIATAYSLGMLHMVPWDMYMPGKAKRYFGKINDFADLFFWIRNNHFLFDDYKTTEITAFDPVSSRQKWRYQQQIVKNDENDFPMLRINHPGILGVVRTLASTDSVHRVIHLVDWNTTRSSFEATINPVKLCGSSSVRISLLQPGRDPLILSEGLNCTFSVPALNPWGMILVEKYESSHEKIEPPVLKCPVAPVVAIGSTVELNAAKPIYVRQIFPEQTEWQSYDTSMRIDSDCVVEARTHDPSTGVFSPASRWRFWGVTQSSVNDAPDGLWKTLLQEFKTKNTNTYFETFPDKSPLLFEGKVLPDAFATVGDVTLTAVLPKNTAFFKIGIAICDDAEVLRPSYRVEFFADAKLIYETPIYNSVKWPVYNQEAGRRELILAVPSGVKNISIKLHTTGFFPDHNRVVWIDPEVLTGKSYFSEQHRFVEESNELRSNAAARAYEPTGYEWTGGEQ
ncbi:MAG: hypothetical protein WC958_05875 [Dehalococcoidales bacterium]